MSDQNATLIAKLNDAVMLLPPERRSFAQSMVKQYGRKGSLSDKQWPWVHKLIAMANGEQPQKASHAVGDLSGILKLFEKAKGHLKHPAIVMHVPCYDDVRINIAGNRARFPGSLNVVSQHRRNVDDGRRLWYGRVKLDGSYEPSGTVPSDIDAQAIAARLREFSADPVAVATEHGKLTGRCCFCDIPLTDERSTAVGYGATCAKHWGMPWGERPTAFAEPVNQTILSAG